MVVQGRQIMAVATGRCGQIARGNMEAGLIKFRSEPSGGV